ncbi:hypothetical protein CEXT_566111 [Caerostris extrusa]|uniref:Uncharacterized protein n=1 Tax=Caerostris extrusa TaxID=172846 RepID=A0AAV4W5I3_CAEEX|nr:hypothetical protein CEXT_566111 [Caerostris extrusa]
MILEEENDDVGVLNVSMPPKRIGSSPQHVFRNSSLPFTHKKQESSIESHACRRRDESFYTNQIEDEFQNLSCSEKYQGDTNDSDDFNWAAYLGRECGESSSRTMDGAIPQGSNLEDERLSSEDI